MTTKIVAGLDGSDTAARAMWRAAELARALGAELHVVSAYGKLETERLKQGSEEFFFSSEEDARQMLAEATKPLSQEFAGLDIHLTPSEGKPAEALVRVAEALDADVIVVGNRRVQGITRVLGSIARDVAAKAHCDVYVAHTHGR